MACSTWPHFAAMGGMLPLFSHMPCCHAACFCFYVTLGSSTNSMFLLVKEGYTDMSYKDVTDDSIHAT